MKNLSIIIVISCIFALFGTSCSFEPKNTFAEDYTHMCDTVFLENNSGIAEKKCKLEMLEKINGGVINMLTWEITFKDGTSQISQHKFITKGNLMFHRAHKARYGSDVLATILTNDMEVFISSMDSKDFCYLFSFEKGS